MEFSFARTGQGGNLLSILALIPLENSRFVYLKGAHNSPDTWCEKSWALNSL